MEGSASQSGRNKGMEKNDKAFAPERMPKPTRAENYRII